MSERKVHNKYYPPDFDASLIPRARKPKNEQYKVRMMIPFSVRCLSCGEYIGCGKKFNSRKETVLGEEYLGIKIFRFYFRCTRCSNEITIKTDPENSDYACENGAVRNYESVIQDNERKEIQKQKKKEEEEGDAMKQLESRTLDNRMEMDILDGLDEIRSLNAQASKINPLDILNKIQEKADIDSEEKMLLTKMKLNQIAQTPCSIEVEDDEEEFIDEEFGEIAPVDTTVEKKSKFLAPKTEVKKTSKIGFGARK